jgi:hypothetical protein
MNIINKVNNYESVKVNVTEKDHPIAFGKMVIDLVNSGLTEVEAKEIVKSSQPTEMEIYYEESAGLTIVDPGVVETGILYSPYSGKLYIDCED